MDETRLQKAALRGEPSYVWRAGQERRLAMILEAAGERDQLLDDRSGLIDSPGLQEFGLGHLSFGEIEHGFPEFRALVAGCRFRDCHHRNEPDCAVKQALAAGKVDPRRYAHFLAITAR